MSQRDRRSGHLFPSLIYSAFVSVGSLTPFISTPLVFAQAETKTTAADLIAMDLEDLVNMDVSIQSAGKTASRKLDLAYAAHVVTRNDIRNSGAQTIPDALRLVPGVTVNQISASEWSVAIRGGGGRFSGLVLVLVNGRTAYNTELGGVNWDELNFAMETIDRIEVIRGPNATAWGPNAVNGIINIITQSSADQPASNVHTWAGSDGHAGISGSLNTSLSNDWSMDVSSHWRQWDGLHYTDVLEQEGQHYDWRISSIFSQGESNDRTTFWLDVFASEQSPYYGLVDTTIPAQIHIPINEQVAGGSTQVEIVRNFDSQYTWKLRASADSVDRDSEIFLWQSDNLQMDLEVEGKFNDHHWIAGLNTTINRSKVVTTPPLQGELTPPKNQINHYGAFISDAIALSDDLQLTLALRGDYNEFTHTSYQPSSRLLWRLGENNRLWFAASRASAIPPRLITDFTNFAVAIIDAQPPAVPLPVIAEFDGNPELDNATYLDAYEAGYRHTFERFNIDISIFDYNYNDTPAANVNSNPQLLLNENFQPVAVIYTSSFTNSNFFSNRGFEFSSRAQINPSWSLQLAYSAVREENGEQKLNTNFSILNAFRLNRNWDLNLRLRHNHGQINYADAQLSPPEIYGRTENYYQADINLRWQITPDTSLDVIANNLGADHIEAPREIFSTYSTLVEPYFLIKLNKSF